MGKQKLVLIGNGMAGMRCIENILKEDAERYEITVFGSEPHGNYSRIMLSSVLQGGTGFEDIVIHSPHWYKENDVRLFSGETVTYIDKENKWIETDQGRTVSYDKLIIATGSSPVMLPLPGVEKKGVISFRTIEDCQKMMEASDNYKKAVVIGGGLLGLEAARGLLNLGMEVKVVHLSDLLMQRQLDPQAAYMLQRELESQGMRFLLNKVTEEIVGQERVEALRFKDGTVVEADLVVMAVGVKPNVQLAEKSGIEINRGIVVDDFLSTDVDDIYAVGECVEHDEMVYGLVQPLYEQGEILARHLCGLPVAGYRGSVLSTQLKISGVHVFSVGQFTPDPATSMVQYLNDVEAVYKKVVFRGNKAVGAVLYGDTREGPKLVDTISKQKIVADQDKASLLESPDPADSFMATLPLSEHVCTCNGVSKETIIQAVQEEELSTFEEVKTCTKASSSCGGCKPAVAELLSYIQSESFKEEGVQRSFCSCTPLTEDEVVEQIQLQGLDCFQKVIASLGWKTEAGCSICRPALKYYLEMIDPWVVKEETSSPRALLQSDGTYTIVPQIYGGLPKIEQLQSVVETVKKHRQLRLAIGSDQRIHILGVQKGEVAEVCRELEMPFVSAGAHRVLPIETGIGAESCGCDHSASLELAKQLERKTELLQTPFSIKIVSACVHLSGYASSKDISVINIQDGWEIYVGGSREGASRDPHLLNVARSREEAEEFLLGLIQYYRESARFKEPVSRWIDRVGLIHIREVLFSKEILDDFIQRLLAEGKRRVECLVNS